MDTNIEIIPSKAEDVFILKDILREADIRECQASNQTPLKALMECYLYSDLCYSVYVKGELAAMFGLSTFKQPEDFGVIWFLGSDMTFKYPVALVKGAREYITQWLQKYKVLHNCVDARNIRHVEWLKCMGFKFTDSVYINGFEFLNFYIERK